MITQLQRACREIETKETYTFSAIRQGKLLVGMNHIAVKVLLTILLSKSKILAAFL